MLISKPNSSIYLGQTFWFIILGIFAILWLFYLVLQDYFYLMAMTMGLGTAVLIAMLFPLATVIALIITGVLPYVLQMTNYLPVDFTKIGWGINAPDIVLLSMAGAIFLETLTIKRKVSKQNSSGLSIYIIFFALWLFFEILRNVKEYGLSAPGEFRYRYFILVLPLYINLFFSSVEERKKLFKVLIFFSILFTLACIPIIGILKGWSIGPESRFLPSSISLGLVYGLVAIFLGKKYGLLKLSSVYLWIISIPVGIVILIDSHRSVWLALLVLLLSLILLKEIRFGKVLSWSIPSILIGLVIWIVAGSFGFNMIEYITTRGSAFINPQEDPTASWRLAIWKAQLERFLEYPVLGGGFGGYWQVYVPELREEIDVSPHSLYLQTLVKIGIVGLLAYCAIIFKVFLQLKRWIETHRKGYYPEFGIALTGLIILIASHAYYAFYAFEYYTWLFVGLSVAVLNDKSKYMNKA